MRLYSWNINGWRSVLRQGLREWVVGTRPDILCLQETRVSPDRLAEPERSLAGYAVDWAIAERPGYSGVATFSREPCALVQTGLGVPAFDREGRVLVHDCGGFDLYNVYFPNGKKDPERLQYKLDFYAAFLDHVNARVAAGRSVIFCGDVNTAHHPIDLARPAENVRISGFLPEERAWLDRWEAAGWVDAFRYLYPNAQTYSWWSRRTAARDRNVGWRLDYFWVHASFLDRVRGSGIATEVTGSDHCPVWLEIA